MSEQIVGEMAFLTLVTVKAGDRVKIEVVPPNGKSQDRRYEFPLDGVLGFAPEGSPILKMNEATGAEQIADGIRDEMVSPVGTKVTVGFEGLVSRMAGLLLRAGWKKDRPTIVCLCGSTKFKEAYEKASMEEGIAGRIVLSVACFPHTDGGRARELVYGDGGAKPALDGLHKRKIELADEILVLNVGGYIGDSTRGEIAHARSLGKKIRWLEEPPPEPVSMTEDASVCKED